MMDLIKYLSDSGLKLSEYNDVVITKKLENTEQLLDKLVSIKSLFGIDYKLYKVLRKFNFGVNEIVIKREMLNNDVYMKGIENIFHTYETEDNGFISYDKMRSSIIKILHPTEYNVLIVMQKNMKVNVIDSTLFNDMRRYLEYVFELENDIKIVLKQYYNLKNNKINHIRMSLNIPFNEDRYLTDERKTIINDIVRKFIGLCI